MSLDHDAFEERAAPQESHAGPRSPSRSGEPYKRPFLRPRSAQVARDIAALDAEKDCQQIVRLLAIYEFPFDLQRALEVALFHT